jgi:hypothetical protein
MKNTILTVCDLEKDKEGKYVVDEKGRCTVVDQRDWTVPKLGMDKVCTLCKLNQLDKGCDKCIMTRIAEEQTTEMKEANDVALVEKVLKRR